MHPVESLDAVGLDESHLARARAEGLLVGRGDGFVSREWRAGGGPLVALHTDEADQAMVCAVPFFAGLAVDPWHLATVHAGSSCPHCATAVLHGPDGLQVRAALPDFAARRGMFPLGLDAQASVVVLVREWRPGERAQAPSLDVRESPFAGEVLAGGRLEDLQRVRNGATGAELVRARMVHGRARLWVVGRPDGRLREGLEVTVGGRAVARIGAPLAVRGRSEGAPRT